MSHSNTSINHDLLTFYTKQSGTLHFLSEPLSHQPQPPHCVLLPEVAPSGDPWWIRDTRAHSDTHATSRTMTHELHVGVPQTSTVIAFQLSHLEKLGWRQLSHIFHPASAVLWEKILDADGETLCNLSTSFNLFWLVFIKYENASCILGRKKTPQHCLVNPE